MINYLQYADIPDDRDKISKFKLEMGIDPRILIDDNTTLGMLGVDLQALQAFLELEGIPTSSDIKVMDVIKWMR